MVSQFLLRENCHAHMLAGDGSLTGRKPDEEGEQVPPSFLCSDGSSLMDIAKLCDGIADCPSGDDERSTLCASK